MHFCERCLKYLAIACVVEFGRTGTNGRVRTYICRDCLSRLVERAEMTPEGRSEGRNERKQAS